MGVAAEYKDNRNVSSGSGNITDVGGVQGDLIINNATPSADPYCVSGLRPVPYPGLSSYQAADYNTFAGRDDYIKDAADQMMTPMKQQVLLFVIGASGCGKSSFARAGLLPELARRYEDKYPYFYTRCAAFTPGVTPLDGLADALCQLGLIDDFGVDPSIFATADAFWKFVGDSTPRPAKPPLPRSGQINLLLIDQFEEMFTIAQADQRDKLLDILANPPTFNDCRTHIVITLRIDYVNALPLQQRAGLYALAIGGKRLLGLRANDLRAAMQMPVKVKYPGHDVELTLVSRLTGDVMPKANVNDSQATSDPSYLPLLQVTLGGLWESGWMKLDQYASSFQSDIACALQQRADDVLRYASLSDKTQEILRPKADQQMMLDILLDLVQMSLDDPSLDARRPRRCADIIAGPPQREALLNAMLDARLLTTSELKRPGEPVGEVLVNITHESLMHNWSRLRLTIARCRAIRRGWRSRFSAALTTWQQAGRPTASGLLTSTALDEAQGLQNCGEPSANQPDAADFISRSIAAANQGGPSNV